MFWFYFGKTNSWRGLGTVNIWRGLHNKYPELMVKIHHITIFAARYNNVTRREAVTWSLRHRKAQKRNVNWPKYQWVFPGRSAPATALQANALFRNGNSCSHVSCKSPPVAPTRQVVAKQRLQPQHACCRAQVMSASPPPPHPLPPAVVHFHIKILTSLLKFGRSRLIYPGASIFSSMCTL